MAPHSSVLAWRIPWTEEPGGLPSMGSQESDTTWRLNHHHPIHSAYSMPGTALGLLEGEKKQIKICALKDLTSGEGSKKRKQMIAFF